MKETEIVASIQRLFSRPAPGVIQGIGDDCAVIRAGRSTWLVTTDSQVEGVHFHRDTTRPERLGRKCLAVNLSDIAAMGGVPRYAFLNLGLPRPVPRGFLASFMRGLRTEAEKFSVALAGGDTHASPGGIAVGLTVIGQGGRRVAYRSLAQAGDLLYVSGRLGQSAAGLRLLAEPPDRRSRISPAHRRELVDAHQSPEPQVALGRFLVRRGFVRAMIDLSDGLASDLRHLCRASGVGAVVDLDRLPLSPALNAAAAGFRESPVAMALQGGEDYQLLFTVPPPLQKKMEAQVARGLGKELYWIGEINRTNRIRLKSQGRTEVLRCRGFDHFDR